MDRDSFRQLALDEMDALYRMAMHLTRHPDEASDLVQETYLKALKAEDRFELREQGIRPWLFKILHNNFYTRVGKRKREPTIADDLIPNQTGDNGSGETPAWDLEHLDWEQVDDRLKHAIEDLPDHYREVLLLWAVEGLKYREIAEVLDVPLGTIMSRLYRARSILSESLGELASEHGIRQPEDEDS
ncbi:RNA polymerase sigma factor [Mucisphaera calidilacus]|uniref:ECF RNA polymerase sigma factor SigR n=1 Tax=Mucisphaera calidilacus TaxID=2527982 RepID=A0A518BTM0_9BACT|nr:sigma-70 family RNA polymerase sigma factor [Mucisphaera calidilacus]QDU70323.1 ECF RNA polymerase sigma factor SigR [Mucisphaera calidilacus]